jgi:hypothetical protein
LYFRFSSTCVHRQQLPGLSPATRDEGRFSASSKGPAGVRGGVSEREGRPTVWDTRQLCKEANYLWFASGVLSPPSPPPADNQAMLGPKPTTYTLPHTPRPQHLANQTMHTTMDTRSRGVSSGVHTTSPPHRFKPHWRTGPIANQREAKIPNTESKRLARGQRQGKRPDGSSIDPMRGRTASLSLGLIRPLMRPPLMRSCCDPLPCYHEPFSHWIYNPRT